MKPSNRPGFNIERLCLDQEEAIRRLHDTLNSERRRYEALASRELDEVTRQEWRALKSAEQHLRAALIETQKTMKAIREMRAPR